MNVLYLMIPLAILLAAAALLGFVWSVRRGQLDDLDRSALGPLLDDEPEPPRSEPTDSA
jgi:cbb3-type cytochrome oxidase maturation protein